MSAPETRLTTGDPNLDRVLHGGIVEGSTVVISGPPGAGKSILAQQIVFANATSERPALMVATFSEPQSKIVAHLSGFDFYTPDAFGDSVRPLALSDALRSPDGLASVVDRLTAEVVQTRPAVVVIDSAKAMTDAAASSPDLRSHVYELVARLSHTGTTLLLVGEYDDDAIATRAEFAVADAILQLSNDAVGAADRRAFRVAKLRGSSFVSGRHSLSLTSKGVQVYPRLESIVQAAGVSPLPGRASLGVEGLDALVGGGLPAGDATLLMGPSGAGKTVLSLHFVATGVAAGEKTVYVSMEESPDALMAKWRSFGMPLDDALADGRLVLHHAPITELDIDRLGDEVARLLRDRKPSRVVFDSLGELAVGAEREHRHPGYIWSLANLARRDGASVIFTQETMAFGSEVGTRVGFSHLFHNVLFLRYLERPDRLSRALTVVKMRDSAHANQLVELSIGPDGMHLDGTVAGATGLLGWTTLSVTDTGER
ncbi:MAG: circadian clock protein KaiC [Sandaracinaceae bacterium]|nr:MAG: circadian clock protein KaiC [Sandaracinaceae bacterium]